MKAAYEAWLPRLERAWTDPLSALAKSYGKAAGDNAKTTMGDIDRLVEDIEKSAVIRNVLCHGSWQPPNLNGASVPLFVNRKKEVFETPIDIEYLRKVQVHVVELACSIIDSVTLMGFQFPGSRSPGDPIW